MIDNKLILVVDDEEANRALLGAMLKSLGYDSILALDGFDALSKLNPEVDLVLLDIMMPGMDGFETAGNIRRLSGNNDVPIIMVTVLDSKEDRLRAVENGANDFISKPVDIVELRVRVASLLKLKESQEVIKRHKSELEIMVAERTLALRESEQRLRAIFETAQDCIFIKDRTLKYTHVNPAMESLLRLSAAQLIGLTDEEIFGTETGKAMRKTDSRVLNGEEIEQEQTRLVQGIPIIFHEIKMPMRDETGAITGICGIARNITERRAIGVSSRVSISGTYPSKSMRQVMETASLAGGVDGIVMLRGETGSGKDYIARFIHDHSKRADGPFFAVNCAAIPDTLAESELFGHERGAFSGAVCRKRGLLELAEGGTLLLNEIGELPLHMQSKLLTFLDTRHFTRVGGEKSVGVNVRLIAATNSELEKEIEAGNFRRDLFFRLNVLSISIPPLRDRLDDLPMLVEEILAQLAEDFQSTDIPRLETSTLNSLCHYHWPGNVRELRNVLERSLMISREGTLSVDLGKSDTPSQGDWSWVATFPPQKPLPSMASDLKRSLIMEALQRSGGKKTSAARLLKISRDALKGQMKTLGLSEAE
jgi:PAS domain S-box-containing protein